MQNQAENIISAAGDSAAEIADAMRNESPPLLESLIPYLQQPLWNQESQSALRVTVLLFIGGLIALYVRFLYRRFSASASDTDSITRVFPLLLMVTTAVIAVVQSSLALSLGLVGALSIVRFRAAIKDPEELVYLFLCIAIGLALGAQKVFLALGVVSAATIFVIGMHAAGRSIRNQKLLLTIRGNAAQFTQEKNGVTAVVESLVKSWSLHRMDIENGRGQLRIALAQMTPAETGQLISDLSKRLPECEFSYVNMNSAV